MLGITSFALRRVVSRAKHSLTLHSRTTFLRHSTSSFLFSTQLTGAQAAHGVSFSSSTTPSSSLARQEPQEPATLVSKVLIANRGEIACRIIRSCHKLNIPTVAVYSEADKDSQHVALATEAWYIGPAAASESYLNAATILKVAVSSGATAIHPGYGFLSENATFARACAAADITFIGPPVSAIDSMGSKAASKNIMLEAHVPVTPGYHGSDQSVETLAREAATMGYPVLIKAVLGGGGKGMRIVTSPDDFTDALTACQREALSSFNDQQVLVEKYLTKPRHVELQIFGDTFGNIVHLFERDCSVQRRHQKVLEEAPAPFMTDSLRAKMGEASVAAAKAVGYVGAGTVEFMLDEDDSFYFMEMNTRLQVEHPVTEMITGKDLVELQLLVASGFPLPFTQADCTISGHAMEARVYAEDPYNQFLPATGTLHHLSLPPCVCDPTLDTTVRVDIGIVQEDEVSIWYDPMIAKVITHGPTREAARQALVTALSHFHLVGLPTNVDFLARTLEHPSFITGGVNTSFLATDGKHLLRPSEIPITLNTVAVAALAMLTRQQDGQGQAMTGNDTGDERTSLNYFRSNSSQQSSMCVFLVDDRLDRRYRVRLYPQTKTLTVTPLDATDEGESVTLAAPTTDNDTSETFHMTLSNFDATSRQFHVTLNTIPYQGTCVYHNERVTVFSTDLMTSDRLDVALRVMPFQPQGDDGNDTLSTSARVGAPMPGKVIQVTVEAGQEVESGESLMIIEAMKMEHVIRAPRAGTVKSVPFKVGDFVQAKTVLVELEEK